MILSRPFDGCRDRIGRAKTHREASGIAWNAFVDEDPYDAHVEVEEDGAGRIWVQQLKAVPPVIAFEIGEFLYQLRSTLDGCVYEAACLNSGQRPPPDADVLEFIFRDSPEDFEKAARRKLRPLTKQQRDVIESVQTYRAPPDLEPRWVPFNHQRGLAMLNDWARKDRHRKLHVAATWASQINPIIIVPKGVGLLEFKVPVPRFILNKEREIATFRLSGYQRGMKVKANPNLTLDLTVDEVPMPCHVNDHMNARFECMNRAVVEVVARMALTFDQKLWE